MLVAVHYCPKLVSGIDILLSIQETGCEWCMSGASA